MGLSICAKLVECCEGHIDFFSEGEDKGSTFNFTMKMTLPSPEILNPNKILRKDYSEEEIKASANQ